MGLPMDYDDYMGLPMGLTNDNNYDMSMLFDIIQWFIIYCICWCTPVRLDYGAIQFPKKRNKTRSLWAFDCFTAHTGEDFPI